MSAAGKVAIVTGAGTGIGRRTSLALLDAGYSVALAGRREEPLETIGDRADRSAITHLTDEAMNDLSGLGPLVFHHRQAGDPEFQRKIDDLKARHFPDERPLRCAAFRNRTP